MNHDHIICNVRFRSSRFIYNNETHTFITEASDLGRNFHLGRVYDDACDEGFVIISERTGSEVTFAMDGVDEDREGDIAGWRFVAVKYPQNYHGPRDLKVLIIND